MMKTKLITIMIFVSNLAFGQIFPDVADYRGDNIISIKKIGYRKALVKDGWITLTTFNDKSKPEHEINYYKGDKRGNYYYSYEEIENIFTVTRIDSSNIKKNNNTKENYYYDKRKLIIKVEHFINEKNESPISIETNIVRDNAGKILSFEKRLRIIEKYNFFYNEKEQVDSIIKTDSENISKVKYIYKYYPNGYISDVIVDYNNPDVVLSDVRCWSEKRNDKYQLRYKYDRYGNWIKRYAITKNRRYLSAKREINYK